MAMPFGHAVPSVGVTSDLLEFAGRVLENRGCRALSLAQVCARGVELAPTIDEKLLTADQATKELERFEFLASAYEDQGRGDLLERVLERLRQIPVPLEWVEVPLAHAIFAVADGILATECSILSSLNWTWKLAGTPLPPALGRMLSAEPRRQAIGEQSLIELSKRNPKSLDGAQKRLILWLRAAVRTFGEDGRPAIRDYLRDVVPVLERCGLSVPPEPLLEIELSSEGFHTGTKIER
jgi:hypothetical protein